MNSICCEFRSLLILAIAWIGLAIAPANCQVLELPSANGERVEIKIEGPVVATKKYSFVVKHQDKDHRVKIVPGISMTLRLNRPFFDFAAGEVAVLPIEADPEDATVVPPRYKLPDPLYVSVQFAHEAQMKRIMSGKSLRLNQYRLSAGPLPQVLPREDDLRLQSLVELDENDKPFITIDGQRRPIVLGFRGATLSGQTIVQIKPGTTKAFVEGEIDRNANDPVVTPLNIEFVPMLVK